MNRLFIAILLAIVTLSGCSWWQISDKGTSKKGDVGNDICAEFPADFVYTVLQRQIVKVEPLALNDVSSCRYYTEYSDTFVDKKLPGGNYVAITLDNLAVANQEKYVKTSGGSVKKDERIKMDHLVLLKANGKIFSIDLIINPNRYLRLDKSATDISDDELFNLAIGVADKLQGQFDAEIQTNPVDLTVKEEVAESQKQLVEKFFNYIGRKVYVEAINLMEASSYEKENWKASFKTLKSVKVSSIEEINKGQWTASKQFFKVTLEVVTDEKGEDLGWQNGVNTRWLTLQKINSYWLITELNSKP